MVPPQDLYAHHVSSYKQLLHAYHEEGLRQTNPALANSKVVLENEGEEMRRDQRERRLVVIGRNGTGKTTLINLIMLVGQPESSNFCSSKQKFTAIDSQAMTGALGGTSKPQAEAEGIHYIQNPNIGHVTNSQLQDLLTDLASYVYKGDPPAGEPNTFLLAAGNPAGSTTGTITQIQWSRVAGAIECFASEQELQSTALQCILRLSNLGEPAEGEEHRTLRARFQALTGQQEVPLGLQSASEITLKQELKDVAGKTRVYSGHDESLASFTCFLKSQLTVSQLQSALHPALASTNIYWPRVGVTVPFVDTPGTSDANPLNAEMTQQAIDDAIDRSSQLLLCGNKTFETEGSLQPYVVQYMKHMITSQHGQPAVQGILMAAQWHNAASLNDDFNQNADKARVASSLNQLQIWLKEANSELPAEDQATATRLDELMKRCNVRVVYMKLYASLCLQSHDQLSALAADVGVSPEDLLTQTNGPWLLGQWPAGLSKQLLAEAAEPYLRRLSEVHLEELVRSLQGLLKAKRDSVLSPEANIRLAEQTALLKQKQGQQTLSLYYSMMSCDIRDGVKQLKPQLTELFGGLVETCNQMYAAKLPSILKVWKKLSGERPASRMNTLFVLRSKNSTSRTAAYKATFADKPHQLDKYWKTGTLDTKLRGLIGAFLQDTVLRVIIDNAVKCLENCVPGHDLTPMVRKAAWACVQPTLDSQADKLVCNLLKIATLKSLQRDAQVSSIRTHLITQESLDDSNTLDHDAVKAKVSATVNATQQILSITLLRHVDSYIKLFESTLLSKSGCSKRGQMQMCMDKLLKQIGSLARAASSVHSVRLQSTEDTQCRQLYNRSLSLQAQVRQDTAEMLKQAADTSRGEQGLGYSVHQLARLNRQLNDDADFAHLVQEMPLALSEDRLCSVSQIRVDVGEGLHELAQVPLPQPLVDLLSLQDLTGLKLPEMAENMNETVRWVGHGHRAVHQACLGSRQSAWSGGAGSLGTSHGWSIWHHEHPNLDPKLRRAHHALRHLPFRRRGGEARHDVQSYADPAAQEP